MGPGGVGGPPPGGGYGGIGGSFIEDALEPSYVVAVIETTKPLSVPQLRSIIEPNKTGQLAHLEHKWGSTNAVVYANSSTAIVRAIPILEGNKGALNVHTAFEARLKEAHAGTATPETLIPVAEWALMHGLSKEFEQVIAEAVATKKENKTLTVVQQVLVELNKNVPEGKDVAEWQQKLKLGKVATRNHYALFHNASKNEAAEVASKIDRLEENLRRFYLWFALQGRTPPIPATKLIAVLPSKEEEFRAQQQAFDALNLMSDGFTAQRENLVVFSPNRLDTQYEVLHNFLKPKLDTVGDPSILLKAQGDYGLQTAMLMRKALEDEADLATASREGSRQLLAASGLLPRNVTLPDWVQFGTASFFETAKGSPWPTVGGAGMSLQEQTNYLTIFKKWRGERNREAPEVALMKVITDRYFRQIVHPKDGSKETEHERVTRLAATKQARTLAWGAAYYFSKQKLDNLTRYYQELAKLPRDLELDEDVLLLTFAKAFDLLESPNSLKVDDRKFKALAQDWDSFLGKWPVDTTLENTYKSVEEIKKQIKSVMLTPQQGQGQGGPGGAAGPGGPPPGGGLPGPGGAGPGGPGGPMGPGGGGGFFGGGFGNGGNPQQPPRP